MQGDDLYHSAYFSPKQLSGRQLARPVSRVRIPRSDSSCAAQSGCVGTGFLLNDALTVVPHAQSALRMPAAIRYMIERVRDKKAR